MIKGLKEVGSGEDVFVSLIEDRTFNEQVSSLIIVDAKGEPISKLVAFFGDGYIFFYEDVDKRFGFPLDSKGRIKVNDPCNSDVRSGKVVEPRKDDSGVKLYETYPITEVSQSDCCTKRPARMWLTKSDTCPPYATVNVRNSATSSYIFALHFNGVGTIATAVSTSLCLDLASNCRVKVRGPLPEVYCA